MTQLRQRVERLESAETTSLHFGASANAISSFPGMVNIVAGSGVSFTPGTGTLTIAATGGGGGGTVASVGVSTGASGVSVTGSPVTTSGTIDLDLGTLANVDDAPSDGTTYGRKNGTWFAAAGITQTDTGILISGGGLLGAVLDPSLTSAQIRGMCTGTYDYSTADSWQLWVSPTPASGSFVLDVWKRSFGNTLPSSADSICASVKPTLIGNGTDFTSSGATSTWTSSLVRGDMLTVAAVTNSAGVKWWALYIPARRTF